MSLFAHAPFPTYNLFEKVSGRKTSDALSDKTRENKRLYLLIEKEIEANKDKRSIIVKKEACPSVVRKWLTNQGFTIEPYGVRGGVSLRIFYLNGEHG